MAGYIGQGKPGVQTTYIATLRDIFQGNSELAAYLPMPVTVDGTASSNPSNSPYVWSLWAGMPFGQITSSKKFANSILGLTSAPLGGGQTTLTTDAATATELVRRVGASGTFNLAGGPTTNGPGSAVRSLTVTYSAVNVTTGAITITATSSGAVSNVNAVEAVPFVDSTGSGTFTLTIEGITTGAITYSATNTVLFANINTALNATFGTSAIVASGASLAAIILTFSGTGYAARPIATSSNGTVSGVKVIATLLAAATGFTAGNNPTSSGIGAALAGGSTTTTAGVTAVAAQEGEFASGSLIQPTDGSQTIKTLLVGPSDLLIVDELFTTRVDVFGKLWAGGGVINTGYIVNYPTDTGHQAYLKTQIKAFVPNALFSDDYI